MAENIKMTRIADLGDGQYGGMANGNGTGGFNQTNDYMTMNVHANPYGLPPPMNEGLPLPVARPPSQNQSQQYPAPPSLPSQPNNMQMPNYPIPPEQIALHQQQMLPSRDIPQDTMQHTQDEQIRPNYIPPPKRSDDFVKDYEKQMEHKIKEYEKEKKQKSDTDKAFDKFQSPIIASILFFILHMPIINTMIFKKFSFLSIYNEDGNFNFYGLILKSFIFGSFYWFIERAIDYLGEI